MIVDTIFLVIKTAILFIVILAAVFSGIGLTVELLTESQLRDIHKRSNDTEAVIER